MNHIYSFEIIEFRTVLAECCKNIFNDNVMAEICQKGVSGVEDERSRQ